MDYTIYRDNVNNRQQSTSTSVLNFDDVKISSNSRRSTRHQQFLHGLLFVFFLLILLFMILFVVFYVKYEGKGYSGQTVCTTPGCIHTASMVLDKIDQEADPCQDFSQYACGKYYKNTVIPDSEHYVSMFSKLFNKNMDTVRLILQEESKPHEMNYVTKMKQFYKLCMDTDTIERIGLAAYRNSDYINEWPTLNTSWNSATFDLNDVTAKYEGVFTEKNNLFNYRIGPDLLDSNKNVLKIAQPDFCLSVIRMRSSPHNDSSLLACQQYYIDVALTLGADADTARKDAKEFIDFEIGLAQIFVLHLSLVPNFSKYINGYNKTSTMSAPCLSVNVGFADLSGECQCGISSPPDQLSNSSMTIEKMSKLYPPIDWHRAIQAIFNNAGMSIHKNTTVVIESPSYFTSLGSILKSTPTRVLQNRYAFDYAVSVLQDLTQSMRDASLKLEKITRGITNLDPRWKQCVSEVKGVFAAGLSKQFVSRTFSERSKRYLENMLSLVKSSFRQQLENAAWMEQETKSAAFRKLDALKHKIGFPDSNFDDDYIDRLYSNMTIFKGRFDQTSLELRRQQWIQRLLTLTRKVDNSNWQGLSMEVNFQNLNEANEIRYFAGILQPEFFSETFPSSINFGAVGSAIGHELTHFFDCKGSQYDEFGNVNNWWQPQDLTEFKNKIQCFVAQYSSIRVSEISTNLNGKLSVDENTADNGGIKAAFRAYKQFSSSGEKELPLPGLNLTLDQQFFVAFGQMHCSVHTDSDLMTMATELVHLPGKYRVLGTLVNNEDFSQTFHCPVGSPMNPAKKCIVW